jgi:hypothetical protein
MEVMVMLYVTTYDVAAQMVDRSRPAEYCPVASDSTILLLNFGDAGTGGVMSMRFYHDRSGYQPFLILDNTGPSAGPAAPHFVKWMRDVKTGFGRTMSSLPQIFGVSRQTLYNWLQGEEPRQIHHAKLEQLAAAAREFKARGFKPTSIALTRIVARGQTFLQLIADGADGVTSAKALERLVVRGQDSRAALDALLGNRKATRLEPTDMGQPSFREDV